MEIQPTQPLVPYPDRGILAPEKDHKGKPPVVPSSESYEDFIKKKCAQIDKEVDERAEVRARRYTRNYNYWWGGERRWQVWTKDGYKSLDAKKVKRLFSNNQFFYQVKTLLATLVRSRSRLVITPAPSATDDAQKSSAARVATRTVQHDQREKLTADFMVREWMDKLLFGMAIRGQWYAKEGSQAKARIPIIEPREIQHPGMYLCEDCGMTGPEDRAGAHQVEENHQSIHKIPGQTDVIPFHAGYEEVQDGEPITYGISPFEFDLAPEARDLASSPYARWQRRVRKSKLKKAYRYADADKGSSDLPVMLQAQEAVKRGKKTESKDSFTVLKTYWIDADEYFEFSSNIPFKAISGFELPAGTLLSDAAPCCLRVDICDNKIMDMRPEVKEDVLSVSVFHRDPLSWEGKGTDDAAELQRWIDDIHTLYIQIQLREALGITLYDKGFQVGAGAFTGDVGTVKGVQVPENKTIKDAMNVWTGNQPNASIFNGLEYVQQSQTNVTGAFPSLAGSTMEGSETARGRIILREQSLQGLGPQLFLAALHDVVWAKQNLKLKKTYWTSERYVPYLEDGEPLGGRWFSASDLDTDFSVDVEADSWMPVTRLDRIDNLTTAAGGEAGVQAMGGFVGMMANPLTKPLGQQALELLGVAGNADPEEKDLRNARHRYSVLKQAIEKAVEGGIMEEPSDEMNSPLMVPPQMAEPFATMPSVVPVPNVDDHAVFATYYRNAIKDAVDSEGIENHPLTKAVLMLLIQMHEEAMIADTQQKQMQTMAAQAPQMMAQQAMQANQEQQQAAKSERAHQQGLEKQAQGSQLRQEEIKAKGESNGDSELSRVTV